MQPIFHRLGAKCGGILALILASGCAPVPQLGPLPLASDLHREAVRSLKPDMSTAWPQSEWWRVYQSAELDALIAEGLDGSPDMAIAAARVRLADAYARQTGAALGPTIDATAGIGYTKQSYNTGFPPEFVPHGWNDAGEIAAQFSFSLDLWGRDRAALRAALSDAQASRLEQAETALLLSTAIADTYADLARLAAQRDVQLSAVDLRRQVAKLVADRVAAGLDTQAELKQANGAVPAALADLAAIDEQMALARNRIAALIGRGPDRGLAIAASTAPVQPRGLPADTTTELIGRRPDIAAARARMEAAAARIKAARADFYPAISLSALIGYQSLGLNALLESGSSFGRAGPAISLPIFHGGAISSRYRGARASFDEAVAAYDRSVVDAYRETADAVTSLRLLSVRLGEARRALGEFEAAYAIARQRYEGGLSTFIDVLTALDRVIQARRTVSDLQSRGFTLDIALVRALGGGGPSAAAGRKAESGRHG